MSEKSKVKIGDIVRRQTSFKVAVGPYLRVSSVNKKYITADTIGSKDDESILMRGNNTDSFIVMKVIPLCVSKEKILSIRAGISTVISHPMSKQWERVYDEFPDLVKFYTPDGFISAYCTLDFCEHRYIMGELSVRLYINKVIL